MAALFLNSCHKKCVTLKVFRKIPMRGHSIITFRGEGVPSKCKCMQQGQRRGGGGEGSHNFFLIEYKVYELKSREHLFWHI